ncbi:MAG: Asp-tRNA(Asn)/Glu-tRNA(Gln) amidotransferase subunit GatC [Parachlamydiaceae bacterium]|nr:Asp-tRNA(Asn)/Glu-tRNA(Gln) amidotransferase subunit GatC [Parachlamydiaceae bacterium]
MANLNKQTIQNLIGLCRINCSDEEQESLLVDLKKILEYIEQLHEIDTENVAPCYHVLEGASNVTREDNVGETLPRDLFLANAPSQIGGMIRVPPVIKQS